MINIGLCIVAIVILLFLYFGVFKSSGAHDLGVFVMVIPAVIGVVIGVCFISVGILAKIFTTEIAITIFCTVTLIPLSALVIRTWRNWRKMKNENRG